MGQCTGGHFSVVTAKGQYTRHSGDALLLERVPGLETLGEEAHRARGDAVEERFVLVGELRVGRRHDARYGGRGTTHRQPVGRRRGRAAKPGQTVTSTATTMPSTVSDRAALDQSVSGRYVQTTADSPAGTGTARKA